MQRGKVDSGLASLEKKAADLQESLIAGLGQIILDGEAEWA